MFTLLACGGGGGGGDQSPNFNGEPVPPPPPPPPPGPPPPPPPPPPPIFGVGNGSGATYQDGTINASQTTLKAGESATLRVNVVVTNRNNEPPTVAQTVTFSSICAANGRATFGTVTTVSPGLYQVPYTNTGCDGADTVTATLTTPDYTDTANLPMVMVGPDVLTVSFVSSTHSQLSLAGIGGNESTEMTFKVAGAQGVPVIGKQVNFSINTSVGGASILAGRETGITDQEGLVRTVLNSGTVAGPVAVRAVHSESGKQGLSSDIVISTGVAVANRFSISHDPFNPVGAFNIDGVNVRVNIIASDVFGNNPTDGTRVSFVAPESGNVENSCQLVNGACSVTWRSTSPRPADMRVEIIAYTDGAENFVDNNGNSLYDVADGAIADTGEPYADENESGAYNVGEFFFDTNRNGVRDVGNTRWDGPCLDKVNPAAVCTGNSTVTIFDSVTIAMSTDTMRFQTLGSFPAPGTTLTLQQGTSLSFAGMIIRDSNTNADALGSNPPPVGTTITFAIDGGGVTTQGLASSTVPNTLSPVGPFGITIVALPVIPPATVPANVLLLLTIQVPGRAAQQFSWPVVVTL
jgi:hypothetical protein